MASGFLQNTTNGVTQAGRIKRRTFCLTTDRANHYKEPHCRSASRSCYNERCSREMAEQNRGFEGLPDNQNKPALTHLISQAVRGKDTNHKLFPV